MGVRSPRGLKPPSSPGEPDALEPPVPAAAPGMMWTVLLFAAQPDTSCHPDLPHSDTGLVEALCGVRVQPARHAAIACLKEEARAAHAVAYATARVPRKLGGGGIGAGAATGGEGH